MMGNGHIHVYFLNMEIFSSVLTCAKSEHTLSRLPAGPLSIYTFSEQSSHCHLRQFDRRKRRTPQGRPQLSTCDYRSNRSQQTRPLGSQVFRHHRTLTPTLMYLLDWATFPPTHFLLIPEPCQCLKRRQRSSCLYSTTTRPTAVRPKPSPRARRRVPRSHPSSFHRACVVDFAPHKQSLYIDMSQKAYRCLWKKNIKTGRVSRKQPYSQPTHAADGGRTAPTDARHVTRLKGARDHVIHGAICELRTGIRATSYYWCAALALPVRAVKSSQSVQQSALDSLSAAPASSSYIPTCIAVLLSSSPPSRSPGAQQPLQMHFLVVKPLPAAAVAAAATTSYHSLSDTHYSRRLTNNNN